MWVAAQESAEVSNSRIIIIKKEVQNLQRNMFFFLWFRFSCSVCTFCIISGYFGIEYGDKSTQCTWNRVTVVEHITRDRAMGNARRSCYTTKYIWNDFFFTNKKMFSCVKQERYLVDLAVAVVFADFAGTQPEEKNIQQQQQRQTTKWLCVFVHIAYHKTNKNEQNVCQHQGRWNAKHNQSNIMYCIHGRWPGIMYTTQN